MLSCKAVGGTKPFNMIRIISEGVNLVCCEVEPFRVWVVPLRGSATTSPPSLWS